MWRPVFRHNQQTSVLNHSFDNLSSERARPMYVVDKKSSEWDRGPKARQALRIWPIHSTLVLNNPSSEWAASSEWFRTQVFIHSSLLAFPQDLYHPKKSEKCDLNLKTLPWAPEDGKTERNHFRFRFSDKRAKKKYRFKDTFF